MIIDIHAHALPEGFIDALRSEGHRFGVTIVDRPAGPALSAGSWTGVSARPADAGVGKCGQVTKGARWMSWHREATKDVVACDKLREAGKRALIRRFLNEETQLV